MNQNLDNSLQIVCERSDWVVVDKPAGLLSVPGKGESKRDCVAARVAAMFTRATGPIIVHRLDMDTSGLMVLGLTPDAQRNLSGQFERREVRKAYIALVDGFLKGAEEGVVDLPMRLDPDNRPYQVIDHTHGRAALTRWRLLALETDRSRLRLEPETGRSHQLRLHCATPQSQGGLGRAIVGDVLYGSDYHSPHAVGNLIPADRLMLHAAELELNDPTTGQRMALISTPKF